MSVRRKSGPDGRSDTEDRAHIGATPSRHARRRRAGLWTLATAGVFAAGLALGLAGGIGIAWLDGPEETARETVAAVPPSDVPETEEKETDSGYSLPVTVRTSERARDAYLRTYEEDLSAAPAPPFDARAPEPKLTPTPKSHVVPEPSAPPTRDPPPKSRTEEPAATPAPETTAAPDAPAAPATWLARATPATLDPEKPILAVVLDDIGVDVKRSRQAVRLPGPLTMAFLPYGYDLKAMVATARANGHDILVHLPMEPTSPDADPGPNALLTGLEPAELDRRIAWNMSRFGDFVGLNNHMGSKFSAHEPGMRRVMREVADRGLLFLDSITTRDSAGYRLAREMGVPFAVRDVFIDHSLKPEIIRAQLAQAVEIAKSQGHAVAIGHPHDETLEALRAWLPTLAGQGVQLAPISAVVKRRYGEG